MKISTIDDAHILFQRWFAHPLNVLKSSGLVPNGDGGIIAMMVVMPLLERYVDFVRIEEGKKRTKFEIIAAEFGLTESDARDFWNVFRDGFCHQAMPVAQSNGRALPGVSFSDGYPPIPTYVEIDGRRVVILDIWAFAQWVLSKFEANPKMLEANGSFPLLPIHSAII